MASLHKLGTSTCMQAIRHVQAVIICQSRQIVKPSSEILQTLPDLFEIYSETQPLRTSRRRSKRVHWALLPCSLSIWSGSHTRCGGKNATISANFTTTTQTLPAETPPEEHPAKRTEESSVLNFFEETKKSKDRNGIHVGCPILNLKVPFDEVLSNLQGRSEALSSERMGQVQNLTGDIQQRRLDHKPIPETINSLDFDHLLNLQTKSGRKKFLNFLARKEKMKERQIEKQATKVNSKVALETFQESGLSTANTIVRRGQSLAESTAHQWNLVRGFLFGPPIVFDLSYDSFMDRREIINTVTQLNIILKINKTLQDPFQIHFANISPGGRAEQELRRVHGERYDNLLIGVTDKNPKCIFSPDELVYLSADSPNVLAKYDPRKTYVIGGFVDHRVKSNVSLGKAEDAGIPHARLPLDEHLRWYKSTKNLTLDQIVLILSELRISGDWSTALQHVPNRKHKGSRAFDKIH